MNEFWNVVSSLAVGAFASLVASSLIGRFMFGPFRRELGRVTQRAKLLAAELKSATEEAEQLKQIVAEFNDTEGELSEAALMTLEKRMDVLEDRMNDLQRRTSAIYAEATALQQRHPWIMRLLRLYSFIANKEMATFEPEASPNVSA